MKTYFPDKSEYYNYQFEESLDLIKFHFSRVLTKLNWKLVGEVCLKYASTNVVFEFRTMQGKFIFRSPLNDIRQISRQLIAYSLFSELNIMPKKYYHDSRCIIEEFVEGESASSEVSIKNWYKLGELLSKVHSEKSENFGTIIHSKVGVSKSIKEYEEEYLIKGFKIIKEAGVFLDLELKELEKFVLDFSKLKGIEPCICHGDVYFENILVSNSDVKLIDWDRISSNCKEYEFCSFLKEPQGGKEALNYIKESYKYSLDDQLIYYFAFLTHINDLDYYLGNKNFNRIDMKLKELKRLAQEYFGF